MKFDVDYFGNCDYGPKTNRMGSNAHILERLENLLQKIEILSKESAKFVLMFHLFLLNLQNLVARRLIFKIRFRIFFH